MAVHTQFGNLSTAELLRQVDSLRHRSPVIEELCQRIEREESTPPAQGKMEGSMPCPVCMAQLEVTFDRDADEFTIEG